MEAKDSITGHLTRRDDQRTFVLARRLGRDDWRKFCDFIEAYIELESPVSARQLREIIISDLNLPDAVIHENTVRKWITRATKNNGRVPQPQNPPAAMPPEH